MTTGSGVESSLQRPPLAQASGRISKAPPSLPGVRRASLSPVLIGLGWDASFPNRSFSGQRGMALQHCFSSEGFLSVSSEMGKEARGSRRMLVC